MLLVGVVLAALQLWLSKRSFVPAGYTRKAVTGGEVESTYLAMGSHEVDFLEAGALMSFKKFEVWFPTDSTEDLLPAVIFVNGTGVTAKRYRALQKHLASWGFVTVATDEEHAWNGFSAEMSVRYLKWLNDFDGELDGRHNPLQGRIDTLRIGITGHSQGGFGVVNALTEHRHRYSYKAAVVLSSDAQTNAALMWEADATQIATPTLIIGSTGKADSLLSPLERMQVLYDQIPDSVGKVLARRNDADHGETLYYADGYVTAWFMFYLQDDKAAGKAFVGEKAELTRNRLYQDVRKNL